MKISMTYSIVIVAIVSATASAAEVKRENFEVKGIGNARMVHEEIGEPISAPERITVSIKCKKGGNEKQIALFRLCKLSEYEYDPVTKILHLNLESGRVIPNTGEVVCDQVDRKEIDFNNSCK